MGSLIVRSAEVADEKFLWEMLFEASYSREQGRESAEELRGIPALARYVEGWGARGDFGVVGGEGDVPQGAAWARVFTTENPAYGFVDEYTPELAIAVVPGLRGSGLGSALMNGLIETAERSYDAVSLSVRQSNPARKLYERLGFVVVPSSEYEHDGSTSVTMVLRFR
ncbi:GNAT family N-acetyltransferase [Nocardia sp. SYP-A9097]|uniref:GNAT family N-acetyltransferase n=1 Tax=Nocardia sp. SYP-A9097 TaxID=2663237 RepID=UPI001891EA94|nr:GNAT family N-acetyltransferase [Nocardia sp. SYP-A9097]